MDYRPPSLHEALGQGKAIRFEGDALSSRRRFGRQPIGEFSAPNGSLCRRDGASRVHIGAGLLELGEALFQTIDMGGKGCVGLQGVIQGDRARGR